MLKFRRFIANRYVAAILMTVMSSLGLVTGVTAIQAVFPYNLVGAVWVIGSLVLGMAILPTLSNRERSFDQPDQRVQFNLAVTGVVVTPLLVAYVASGVSDPSWKLLLRIAGMTMPFFLLDALSEVIQFLQHWHLRTAELFGVAVYLKKDLQQLKQGRWDPNGFIVYNHRPWVLIPKTEPQSEVSGTHADFKIGNTHLIARATRERVDLFPSAQVVGPYMLFRLQWRHGEQEIVIRAHRNQLRRPGPFLAREFTFE